jgi:hypothetical protein
VRQYPQLGLLIHLPMGGKRNAREAARLKAMGARAGVSDYLLPVLKTVYGPSDRFPVIGLWLELKAPGGKVSIEQAEWGKLMLGQGYEFKVVTGWDQAAQAICDYLGIGDHRALGPTISLKGMR